MKTNTTELRVCASYARRSKDLDQSGMNVANQQRDNMNRAKSNGDTIAEEHQYVDNDTPASRFATRKRTEWLLMREAIEHGPVYKVYTLMLDRLLRLPGELEWLIDQAFIGNFRSIVTDEEELDLTTEAGISRARGMAHAADMEVRKLSKRVRRAFDEKRANGESHQPVITFGWLGTRHGHDNNHGDTIHRYEADLIRDAATRVLRGTTVDAIAAEWTANGVLKPKDMHHARKANTEPKHTPWTGKDVWNALTTPRNRGQLMHGGEVIGELPTAILDKTTATKLMAMEQRRKTGPRTGRRSGAWTGVVRCGGFLDDGSPCGAVMCVNPDGKSTTFRCKSAAGRRACGHNAITAKPVQEAAHAWLTAYVDDATLRVGVMREDNGAEAIHAELTTLKTRKDEALQDRASGILTRAEANKVVVAINNREAELARQLTATGARDSLSPWLGDGDGIGAWLVSDKCSAAEHRAAFLASDHCVWIKPRPELRPSKTNDARARIVIAEEHPATTKRARRKRAA